MARKIGSANKAAFQKPGQIKSDVIRLRVSAQWLATLQLATKENYWFKGRTQSQVIRILVMEGLLKHCDQEHRQLIQNAIEHL